VPVIVVFTKTGLCGQISVKLPSVEVHKNQFSRVRLEVFTAVKKSKLVFWAVTPWALVGRYQSFEGAYRENIQS
jgi:hypothetical protein